MVLAVTRLRRKHQGSHSREDAHVILVHLKVAFISEGQAFEGGCSFKENVIYYDIFLV